MKLRTRSASCQMSSYCCWVIGMTICLAPRGTCVEEVSRSRSTCRVFGRASILASPSLERSRMTKMPPAGYPAFLQYLQSGRVSKVRGFIVRSLGRFLLCRVLNLGCNSVLMGDLGRDSLLPGVNGFLDVLLELLQVEFLDSFPGDQFGLVGHLDLDLLVGVFRNHDDQFGISIDLDDRAH